MIKIGHLFLSLCFFTTAVLANTGVFHGAGSRVMPIKNETIQLKSEEVNFVITVPEKSGNHGMPFLPRVDVKAVFNLLNTSNHKEKLQIGFPFFPTEKDKSILGNINFRVKSNGKNLSAKMKEGLIEKKLDPKGYFKKVFVWHDIFTPHQAKQIDVSYQLDMSVSAMDLRSKLATKGMMMIFHYITQTAYTWRQPVENAVFKFDLNALPEVFKLSNRKEILLPNHKERFKKPFKMVTPLIFVDYDVAGQWDKNTVTFSYQGAVPKDGISIYIEIVHLPAKADEIEQYVLDLPEIFAEARPYLPAKRTFNQKAIITNMLNFYRGLYEGKLKGDMLSDGNDWGFPSNPEKKKALLAQQSRVNFLAEEDRQEVKKIIAWLEKKVGE